MGRPRFKLLTDAKRSILNEEECPDPKRGKGGAPVGKINNQAVVFMYIDIEKVDTLSKALRFQTQKYGDKVFMCHKEFGIWNPYSWKDVYEHSELVHLGLVSMGLERGDLVGIIGDNDPRWFWAEYASQAAGSIVAGMYVDYHYAEVKYVLSFSQAKFAFAKDQEMVDKILEVKDSLPNLQKVIYWEDKGLWFYDYPWLMSYRELEELGREYKKTHPHLFEENIDKTRPGDPAVIMLSSGTTRMTADGVPRSQMSVMSHRALMLNLQGLLKYDPWLRHRPLGLLRISGLGGAVFRYLRASHGGDGDLFPGGARNDISRYPRNQPPKAHFECAALGGNVRRNPEPYQ